MVDAVGAAAAIADSTGRREPGFDPARGVSPDAWRGGRLGAAGDGGRTGPRARRTARDSAWRRTWRPPRGSRVPRSFSPQRPARSDAIGFVVIPVNPPPVFVALRELGPTLTWVGLVLLAIGAASAALLIFSPAHRRLRTLEQAARALGEGRTDVRAVESGGDEVSALAHAFNRMADDLGARAEALAARTARAGSCWPTSRTS